MKIIAVIISMPTRDSSALKGALTSLLGKENVYLFDATTPEVLGCERTTNCAAINHPKITCVEFAVARSHDSARNFSLETSADISIILEDDAALRTHFKEQLELFQERYAQSSRPTGLHCYPEQFGILINKQKSTFLRCVRVPDYAVGYLLNQKALELASGSINLSDPEVADWPKSMRRINWLAPKESMVSHQELLSYVEQSRIIRQKTRKSMGLIQEFKLVLNLLVFFSLRPFGRKYGHSQIASENLRSYVIGGSDVFEKSSTS